LGVFLLVLYDELIVAVFVFAAVARYELIRAQGQWPPEGIQLAARDADWSLRRAIALAGLESWFVGRKYRMGAVALVNIVFFVVTSAYLLWLVWIST
jgi:hypothetical protein